MDLPRYLARISYAGPVRADAETLLGLHRAHMFAVPFENLDISRGRPIRLDEASLWDKIVLDGRGGFCYELNGLFASLLRLIGFEVIHLNARVFNKEGNLGIDFDHLALLVRAPGETARLLADVGFGDSFNAPLEFDNRGEQPQGLRAYRLEQTTDGYVVWERDYNGTWSRQYWFNLHPQEFPRDYEAACLYHQTSPASSFTRSSIISRATPRGRISLEDGRLIVTTDGQREERPVGETEYPLLLEQHFGISFDD
jgi:N-hydroxyarylamine O-acetyltransferase